MYEETTYHIYAQDRCLYANLKEEEFDETWEMLKVMVGLLKTDYTERDLSYIKLKWYEYSDLTRLLING
jgi:hypothetical protein